MRDPRKTASVLNLLRWRGGENIAQYGEHVRDPEGLLEAKRLAGLGFPIAIFQEITSHVNYRWFVFARGGEDALGGG